ncbi:MAG: DUF2911 domain-containing protein [Thermoanaerobaculia bacterium]
MKTRALITPLALVALLVPAALSAQDLHPSRRPSPMGMARTHLGETYVRIVYSRPYQRGRDNIFGTEESGALVPFGKAWRTGANEATEITVTGDVGFGDAGTLPAGTYSIYSIPGPERWSIHFNSALGLTGTVREDEAGETVDAYDPADDVLVVEAAPTSLEETVDQFTISFEETEGGADMIWRWIDTEIRVPIHGAAG